MKSSGVLIACSSSGGGVERDVHGRGARLDRRYQASVAISMNERGYLMELPGVPAKISFLNALQACVRDFECAYWE